MARYVGPTCRLCRREGVKLFLKGAKCSTPKCPVERRGFPPGQHGQRRSKPSDYALQLREKQKAKRIYGLLERSFKFSFRKALKQKGVTGEKMLEMLERRLDNVVFRTGFAASRAEARQIVSHGAVSVNTHKVDVPSYQVRIGDVVQIRQQEAATTGRVKRTLEATKDRPVPTWITVDAQALQGVITRLPTKDDIGLPIQEQLIVELYSK